MDIVSRKLSEEAINMIAQVDSICNYVQDNEPSNPILCSLINDAKAEFESLVANQNMNILYANMELAELNDFSSTELATEKTEDINVNKIYDREDSTIDDSDRIVQISKNDSANILPTEELVDLKNESERELDIIVADWKKQITVSDRQNFITHLSANPKSIFLSRIFAPWLRSEETFLDAVETLVGIVGYLPQQSINMLFIPIFMEKECVLIREDQWLQDLFVSMTDSQKNNLLCSYLDEVGTELQNNDIHILYKFIERTQLNVNTIKRLLEQLLTNIEHISSDRYLGNMLLLIAQQFSTNTPQEIIHLMAALCNQFKGVMRYRIKTILKTVAGASDN